MSLARKLADCAVPLGIAATALLNARTVNDLVGSVLEPSTFLPKVSEARAASPPAADRPGADSILDRNPFDHVTGSLRPATIEAAGPQPDPWALPSCSGVRPVVLVRAEDPEASIAAIDVAGKRVLRRAGGEIDGMRVAWIGRDRVWLEQGSTICQAKLGAASQAATSASPSSSPPAPPSDAAPGSLEKDLASKIQRISATEFQVDRSAVDRLLEAQAELMKARLVPVHDAGGGGVRIFGVKPGSALAMLGIENGDQLQTIGGAEVSTPEKMIEVYARLRTGTLDRMTVRLVRQGRTMNVDYVIR